MTDRKEVMKWLGKVKELEMEIKLLNASKDKYFTFLSAKGTPNPNYVSSNKTHVSRPTEDSVVQLDKYKDKIDKINERIQMKEDEIDAIKTKVEDIYYESEMKTEWYQAICYFYFQHMTLYEIADKVLYGVSTVKKHKEQGLDVLVERMTETA